MPAFQVRPQCPEEHRCLSRFLPQIVRFLLY
nr:MAG TPA: hypothetical protein [Caudoviricetes sp.]DAM21630.1 MAG TPA: hypothetical protein [Caudoviricetes sp.]DAM49203.1 MAG TPA: hypothetical protein [Bacteriophage sp.]